MIELRKPTESDMQRFKECLAAEFDHHKQDPEVWTTEPGEFMVFYDEKGNRVWVRLERVLRVHFQHDQKVPQKEMVRLIYNGLRWVVGAAREKEFNEVIFESRAPRLIQFCKKLFGFKSVEGNYSLCVAPADNRSN